MGASENLLKLGLLPQRVANLSRRVSEAITIGLLDKQSMADYIERVYSTHLDFYNPNHYQLDFEDAIFPFIAKFHDKGELLDAFCGQGREARFFAERGFNVTGIDGSVGMIEGAKKYAQEAGFKARFEVANCLQYESLKKYDVIYTSPWMYSTFNDPQDRIRMIKYYSNALKPNGILVISYKRFKYAAKKREKFYYKISTFIALITANQWQPRYGDFLLKKLFYHYFIPNELESELEAAHLKIVCKEESKTGYLDFCILVA